MNHFLQFTVCDEAFALGYMHCNSSCIGKRIAAGILEHAKTVPISLRPGDMLIGFNINDTNPSFVRFSHGGGLSVNAKLYAKKTEQYADQPEILAQYAYIYEFFRGKTIETKFAAAKTELEKAMSISTGNYTYDAKANGHATIDYGAIAQYGTDGMREKIARYRPLHPEQSEWYDGLCMSLDAVDILAERYRLLALENASSAEGEHKAIYERFAAALETVPKKPAYDFFSAMQSFHLLFSYDGTDSPGHFDQYMYPFYKDSDKADARKLLCCLWDHIHEKDGWNLCIGGSDENWNDTTNELSYEILSVTKEKGYNKPNLTLRWHRNTSDEFLMAAIDCLATGVGVPSLYNDEAVCPALEALGIPPSDSHLYAMNGCNQIDIQGKSYMGLDDGELSLPKCLEYALTDGVCLHTMKKISISTGDARTFTTFEQVWDAFRRQLEYVVNIVVNRCNLGQKMYANELGSPLRSVFTQGCIEKGKDFFAGGPVYNHAQILTEGLADCADSLTALKHFVFETHEYTMEEMVDAMITNFEDREEMRQKLLAYPKFGNGEDEPDEMAGKVQRLFFRMLNEHKTYRGFGEGAFGGGCSPIWNSLHFALFVGAAPNGRLHGEPFADSIGATPGMDKNGPTALIRSCLHYDHTLANSGFILQLKFDKKEFSSEDGRKNFAALVKTYFTGGGQQMAISVVNPEDLLDAQIHPDKHENLMTRIGGFSAKFTTLGKDAQDGIIQRTLLEI